MSSKIHSIKVGKKAKRLVIFLAILSFIFTSSSAMAATPDDPFFSKQWYLGKISALAAWDTSTGSSDVVVAIIDTGVDIEHPDLAKNIWINPREVSGDGIDNDRNGFIDDVHGWNFVENINNPRPQISNGSSFPGLEHGTVLAGIVAAVGNNGIGVTGIGWHTRIMPIRAIESNGVGNERNIIQAIDYATHNGASIINLSFTTEVDSPQLRAAVERAKNAGVLIVAATGNDDGTDLDHKPVYPVCDDGPGGENWVLGVTSLNRSDQRSSFANYGSLCVDLAAPGEEIVSTLFPTAGVSGGALYGGSWNGTSFAAPVVSGVAALVRSVAPRIDRTTLIDVLKRSAISVDSLNPEYRGRLGWGRIDAFRALAEATVASKLSEQKPVVTHVALTSDSGQPRVWVFDADGGATSTFFAYNAAFRGGVRVAAGDLALDDTQKIVTIPGPGGGPQVRIFDIYGTLQNQFNVFDPRSRNGGTVAIGNVDAINPGNEIVVGAGRGDRPRVQVWSASGTLLSEFSAYADAFRGGIEVAVGDTDGDGVDEITTAPGAGGGPHVRTFDNHGKVRSQFFADSANYRGGLHVAMGNLNGDDHEVLVISRATASAPTLHIFSSTGRVLTNFPVFAGPGPLFVTPAVGPGNANSSASVFATASLTSGSELRNFSSTGTLLQVSRIPNTLRGIIHAAPF